jgi:hypothetical protein
VPAISGSGPGVYLSIAALLPDHGPHGTDPRKEELPTIRELLWTMLAITARAYSASVPQPPGVESLR